MTNNNNYLQLIRETLQRDDFVRAVFSGVRAGMHIAWQRVVLRPVIIRQSPHMQFSYFDERKDISKNYARDALNPLLDELLSLPFRNYVLTTTHEIIQINISAKGKPLIGRKRQEQTPDLDTSHNRQKNKILTDRDTPRYLQAIGITDKQGRVRSGMYRKFTQINEFLRLIAETGVIQAIQHEELQVVDFGCGNAYLTFAVYHYLTEILGRKVQLCGVDRQQDLIEKHRNTARMLGWSGISFANQSIQEYNPMIAPDLVIALHACDTATDDAIAQGIRAKSELIVCAPCCQHHIQEQLADYVPEPFTAIMRFGLFHERIGDVLTDALRVLILKIMGYRVDVVQFVDMEHTAKNLMIRAVRTGQVGMPVHIQEYNKLCEYWQLHPYLEDLLRDEFAVFAQKKPYG